MSRSLPLFGVLVWLSAGSSALAEPPSTAYAFPAGGQRGTTVQFRVGGHFLHDRTAFEMIGSGVTAPGEVRRTDTIWFEGPLIKQPASQAAEDYPQDYAGQAQIAADAPLGARWWRCWNAQGITSPLPLVVGDLPEVVEEETDGEAIPVHVALPVTINGRIFPREDSDIWTFDALGGQSVTCAVVAKALGSPLVARLEIRGPDGMLLAESTGNATSEALVRLVAPVSGRYAVRIHDIAAGGFQNYVYRLTVTAGPWIDYSYPLGGRRGSKLRLETIGQAIGQAIGGGVLEVSVPDVEPGIVEQPIDTPGGRTNAIRLDVSDLPEVLEAEPNDAAAQSLLLAAPVVLNGRIQSPGDIDVWTLTLAKLQPVVIDARTTRLGSPLAMVLTIRDAAGKELAQADASTAASGDLSLPFNPPADGKYLVEVRERFDRRGGPQFAYRIAVAPPRSDFRLLVPDSLAVDVGGEKTLDVLIERQGDMKSPITLHADGLPAGVSCDDVQVAPGANKASLTFKSAAKSAVVSSALRVVGRGEIAGRQVERTAVWAGQKDGLGRGEPIAPRLATTLPTPFKYTAQFSFIYAPRGGTLRKKYTIDRGGFDGPLEARLADRQGRHLQGVSGPVVAIPAGATEFEYPLQLPPWMELGRTSRTNLMLTGEVQDATGAKHTVSYTTRDQNEQLIAVVTAAALRISPDRASYAAEPGQQLNIPLAIRRDNSVTSPVRLELVVPRHMRDIAADPVTVPADADQATLVVRLGASPGPLNMPLVIRASGQRKDESIVAETPIELIHVSQ